MAEKIITEKSLLDALCWTGLRELPEPDDKEHVWIKALALVKKFDGTQSYVYMEKDKKTLENKIIKDFGSVSTIFSTEEIYPFSYLKDNYIPKFKTAQKNERVAYLSKYDKKSESEYAELSLKELDKEIMRRAVVKQLEKESSR